jgi:lipocalin-like protein
MKKPQLKLFILALLIIAGLAGCKKTVFNDIPVTTDNLVGSYKLTAVTGKSGSYPEFSIYGQYAQPCQQDDIYTLNADFSAIYTDAGTKCDVPGDDTFTWSLTGNVIAIRDLGGNIDHFDGKTLIVSKPDSSTGTPMTIKATFTKQ